MTKFIVGGPVSDEAVHRPETLRRVADSIRRVHDGPAIPGLFVPFRIVEAYRALAHGARCLDSGRLRGRRGRRPPDRGRLRGVAGRDPALPQRSPERELHRRRRADPDPRLGVRGPRGPVLRSRELLGQPWPHAGRGRRSCSRPTRARPGPTDWPASTSCGSCPTSARRCGASSSRGSARWTSTSRPTRRSTSSGCSPTPPRRRSRRPSARLPRRRHGEDGRLLADLVHVGPPLAAIPDAVAHAPGERLRDGVDRCLEGSDRPRRPRGAGRRRVAGRSPRARRPSRGSSSASATRPHSSAARGLIRSRSIVSASPVPSGWSSRSRIASTTSFSLSFTIWSFERSSSARGIVGASASRRPSSGITWQNSSRS